MKKIKLKFPKIQVTIPKISSEKLQEHISEAAMIGGILILLKCLYMIYPPSMWIIGGILLMLLGFPARRKVK
jgi:hypothetical protein